MTKIWGVYGVGGVGRRRLAERRGEEERSEEARMRTVSLSGRVSDILWQNYVVFITDDISIPLKLRPSSQLTFPPLICSPNRRATQLNTNNETLLCSFVAEIEGSSTYDFVGSLSNGTVWMRVSESGVYHKSASSSLAAT